MKKLGVTGTRQGMNEIQRTNVEAELKKLKEKGYTEFHHGDCIGVDVEAAEIAKTLGYKIVCHPPLKNELRAYFKSDEYRPAKTYFKRNRVIVDETNELFVVPMQNSHQTFGGTWYTYDYAKRANEECLQCLVQVFYPNGRVEK